MNATLIAVGIDDYKISTEILIRSVKKHEPDAHLIVVDNASPVPYPNAHYIANRVCMSAAMNFGATFTGAEWLVFMNNDVECTGPFLELMKEFRQDTIYGVDMLDWWGRRWLDGWIMAIPRRVWNEVGTFDEAFTYAGFEDADYCFRALEKGYHVEAVKMPFIHRELHSRFTMPNYMAQRDVNIDYLCNKWGIVR